MKKTARGFTLVEVLITILIIGVLSGLIYLALRPSGDMVKRKACEGNRATILLALDAHRFSSGLSKTEYGLQSFIDEGYKNEIANKEAKCPAGGTYSAAISNDREVVVCSVHGGGPSGGGDNGGGGNDDDHKIPNTGIPANDIWSEKVTVNPENGRTVVSIKEGEKFFHNDNYYVAISDENRDIGVIGGDVDPEDLPSNMMTQQGYGLVQVLHNEPIIVWETLQIGDKVKRGNILLYDDEYYLCMVPSARSPIQIKFQNHDLGPEGDPNMWFKLNN